jgi:hypothetical protein
MSCVGRLVAAHCLIYHGSDRRGTRRASTRAEEARVPDRARRAAAACAARTDIVCGEARLRGARLGCCGRLVLGLRRRLLVRIVGDLPRQKLLEQVHKTHTAPQLRARNQLRRRAPGATIFHALAGRAPAVVCCRMAAMPLDLIFWNDSDAPRILRGIRRHGHLFTRGHA